MPDEAMWSTFFDPESVLRKLGLKAESGDVVDFGCGYGTFTIPAATITTGLVHGIDIDPVMTAATQAKAEQLHLANVRVHLRDFAASGTGLADGIIGYAMLFNIVHAEQPLVLLNEAKRVLKPGGLLAVTHWKHDPSTPRGPSMRIRPRPEQCRGWADEVGFELVGAGCIDLPPYHYGIVFRRGAK